MKKASVTLTPEQADAFGKELDAIKQRVMADLGQEDVDYIRRVIKMQRTMEVAAAACCSREFCRRHGSQAPHCWQCRRS